MRTSTRPYSPRQIRRASVAFVCALSALILATSTASAQVANPDSKTAGALPFIVIISDTSTSTEYTTRGDGTFPQLNGKGYTTKTKLLGLMNEVPSSKPGSPPSYSGLTNNESPTSPNAFFGPCAVWEPKSCNVYERPTHYFDQGHYGPPIGSNNGTWSTMTARMRHVRNNLQYRLKDDDQPKHITIKEILTGDMILTPSGGSADPETLSSSDYGPGCWLVPRQFGTKSAPEMQYYCPDGRFRKYADVRSPIPHFQEVYNYQKHNGLIDKLSRAAIFAYSGLDGFPKGSDPGKSWSKTFNDPYLTFPQYPVTRGPVREDTDTCNGGQPCYNLGVNKIVGLKSLDSLTETDLSRAATYTQLAVTDAGYMAKPEVTAYSAPRIRIQNPQSRQVFQFGSEASRYLNDLFLGTQPIAQSTPLAAAVYDVYNYFTLSSAESKYPLNEANDPYANCRDRHVILISDGSPDPERPSPNINSYIGSTSLSAAFGYNPLYFPYRTTQEEIAFLHQYRPPGANAVKVYIVALLDNLPATMTQAQRLDRQSRLRKLDTMAAAGGTCASHALGDSWISTTTNPRECPRNGGPGVDLGRACLDTTPRGNWGGGGRPRFEYTEPQTGNVVPCKYPALVLTKNDRADLESALSITLNDILEQSGLRSRTRTVYSEDLQSIISCNSANVPATGVNEFLSGMKTAGSSYWAGLLYRNTYACGCNSATTCSSGGSSVPVFTNLGQQISEQVTKVGGSYQDNRRLFTSLLSPDLFDYAKAGNGDTYRDIPITNDTRFFRPFIPYIPTGGSSYAGSTFGTPRMSGDTYPGRTGMQIELEPQFIGRSGALGAYNAPNQFRSPVAKLIGLPAASSIETINSVFNTLRGRTDERYGRALGGIYNGNPVVLDPPSYNIPIESYRQFKEKMSKRPPMLFVPTIDGFLHAIYGGKGQALDGSNPTGVIRHRAMRGMNDSINNGNSGELVYNTSSSQREAWAYYPFFLLPQLAASQSSNPYLLDGTPSIKDVRLCNASATYNQNPDVCGNTFVTPSDQWRTTLVQGLGLAGKGYFALDVTYEGGALNPDPSKGSQTFLPDPIPLWEFNPSIEENQAKFFYKKGAQSLIGIDFWNPCGPVWSGKSVWQHSLMGISVSDPEIGTLLVKTKDGKGRIQRPIALFGGGEPDPNADLYCGGSSANVSGKAIYIIDMQTGSILRRFVGYQNGGPSGNREVLFPDAITGSPSLFNNFTGTVATRGYIGDAAGRLYKIDLSSADPEEWKVYLFFDPAKERSWLGVSATARFGPANYRPAISKMADENLLIVYGLGEVGDRISTDTTQAIIGLRDRIGLEPSGNLPVKANTDVTLNDLLWRFTFQPGEKLTGEPFIFNNVTYFPTYTAPNSKNLCIPGNPQINRIVKDQNGWVEESTTFDGSVTSTVIRGLSLRTNPCCPASSTSPELVAQTGGASLTEKGTKVTDQSGNTSSRSPESPGSKYAGRAGATGELSTFRQNIKNPVSQSIPISWTRVIN